MPFDKKVWQTPAKQGDVAGIAIYASLAVRNLNLAIMAIQAGEDPSEYMKEVSQMADDLFKMYQDMSGYTPDGE